MRNYYLCIGLLLLLYCSEAFVVGRHYRTFQHHGHHRQQPAAPSLLRSQTEESKATSSSSSSSSSSDNNNDDENCGCDDRGKRDENKPEIPQPFVPAMDPEYLCRGPVGGGNFVVSRTGGPTIEELSNENMLRIVELDSTDLEVNTLVWKCLGYRFDPETESWKNDEVFPNWREKYPAPPDLIGMQRVYSRAVDEPSLRSNQSLVRSIPMEHKQSLKPALKPLGWPGYQFVGLTPNKTRRAQCANWLVYYRDQMFGYTLEELKERRERKKEGEAKREGPEPKNDQDDFKPPVKEVF